MIQVPLIQEEPARASRRFVLVSCSKSKRDRAQAAELYTSRVFKRSLAYARTLEGDAQIRILSAEHGVIELTRDLERYDTTLRSMGAPARRAWADRVGEQLRSLGAVELVVLAGELYIAGWRDLVEARITEPLKGLGNGPRFVRLGELIDPPRAVARAQVQHAPRPVQVQLLPELPAPGHPHVHPRRPWVNVRAKWGYFCCEVCSAEMDRWIQVCPACGAWGGSLTRAAPRSSTVTPPPPRAKDPPP